MLSDTLKYLQAVILPKKKPPKQRNHIFLMLCSTGAFTMAIRRVNGRKQKLNFTEILKKRFMSDKITITEYDVFANR